MADRPRVLLTGASGLRGQHILHELLVRRVAVRVLVHRAPVEGPAVERVTADLAAPATLERVCHGVDILIHAAARVSEEPAECEAVNARGTTALVDRARRAGVKRVLFLSHAAVYGNAIHRGASESQAVPAAVTPVSRSRQAAERAVLAAGGTVLRPLFVYGDGDTRFIPAILRAARSVPFLVDGGRARLSVIAASDLAAATCDLALASEPAPGAYHATDGRPVSYRAIVQALSSLLGTPVPRLTVPYLVARPLLGLLHRGLLGRRRGSASWSHRLFLISRDHYYDSTRLWRQTGRRPGPPLTERLSQHAEWYRRFAGPDAGPSW